LSNRGWETTHQVPRKLFLLIGPKS